MRFEDVQEPRALKLQRPNLARERCSLNQKDSCVITLRNDRTQGAGIAIIMRGTKNNFKAVIVVQMPHELSCY